MSVRQTISLQFAIFVLALNLTNLTVIFIHTLDVLLFRYNLELTLFPRSVKRCRKGKPHAIPKELNSEHAFTVSLVIGL